MSVVECAWRDCQRELKWARHHLRGLEEAAAQIRRDRLVISTGVATLQHMEQARVMLREIRQDLANFEAALRRLAEGVDAGAAVR